MKKSSVNFDTCCLKISANFICIFLLLIYFRLDDHLIAAHHFRKDEFFCELCSQRFCHRPLLLKHRALQHNEIRKYPCENCTKVSGCYQLKIIGIIKQIVATVTVPNNIYIAFLWDTEN